MSEEKKTRAKTGLVVLINEDLRSRFKKFRHGGDMSGKIGHVSAVNVLNVEGQIWSLDYPTIAVGTHDIEGLDCFWSPVGRELLVGDIIDAVMGDVTKTREETEKL